MMDYDFELDLDKLMKSIDEAEVMSLFFPTYGKALVIDTRHNDAEGPMVRIVSMAASPQERLRSIRRLRPTFPSPHNLTLIPWSRYVDSLVSLGIWDRIVQRFKDSGHKEAVAACESALAELRRLEKAELASVVKGENYRTVWSARE